MMIKILLLLAWFLIDYVIFGIAFPKVKEIVNHKFINFILFMGLRFVSILFIAFGLRLFELGGLI